jgi:predicted dehydrogenase
LDHDHVWDRVEEILAEPDAELVGVADTHQELIEKMRKEVPSGVAFFKDYVAMLDQVKPQGVLVTTSNDRHLEILRECAKRHIDYMTEKPMAANAEQAREMLRLARDARIKLMVNYWNLWAPATEEIHARIEAGEIGPVQKIVAEYGHRGPREIGVSKYFAEWLYDPAKNGGGALADFGCYGADWALWLKGRPKRVYATSLKLKSEQHNPVEDDAIIVLEYTDATAILMPSWDWPYNKGEVQVYGPKGSLVARGDGLLYQPGTEGTSLENPEGRPIKLQPLPPEKKNGIAHFVWCIRNNKAIEGAAAPELNVAVNEILDAAKESICTGRAVELAP